MKEQIVRLAAHAGDACRKAHSVGSVFVSKHGTMLLLGSGALLLTIGLEHLSWAQNSGDSATTLESFSEASFADDRIRGAVGGLFQLIEGAFGALIMVVAGLGAIITAAMGAYRAAMGMLVVAVGAFILRSLVSLFFGTEFTEPSTLADGAGG